MQETRVITLVGRDEEAAYPVRHSGAPTSINEAARVAALHEYGILDTPREAEFDDLTRVAAMSCGTRMSAINLVDSRRQWCKSEFGLDGLKFPIESSICAHAIVGSDLFVVRDLRQDPRFAQNPLVVGKPHLRFYAGAPLRTADGHALGMVCVLDVQPRELDAAQAEVLRVLAGQVMAQLELRRRLRSAERLLRELIAETRSPGTERHASEAAGVADDDMLGLVSHELGTPLMLIDGNARLLRHTTDEEERSRAIDEIVTSTRRMSRLITNMMVLARNGEGDELLCEPMVLRLSFADALAEHGRLHPDSPVALEPDPGLPPVMGNAMCVDQVLTNLLSNAAKYGDPAKPVTLTAVRRGEDVLVTVANGGAAVDPENVERLFAPFFREAGPLKNKPGLGLGLAVCRRLIEAQDGRIWASARPGGGLEVCFTLPVADEE